MNTDTAVEGTSNEHIPSGKMKVDDDEEIDKIVDSSDSKGILTFKSTRARLTDHQGADDLGSNSNRASFNFFLN